jgi:uncharacterized protein YjbJ (UPF0337 family)
VAAAPFLLRQFPLVRSAEVGDLRPQPHHIRRRGAAMNWDQIEGMWKQAKGKLKEQWGRLTDDDLDMIAGKRDQLLGKLQQKYGWTKEQAEREVNQWETTYRT